MHGRYPLPPARELCQSAAEKKLELKIRENPARIWRPGWWVGNHKRARPCGLCAVGSAQTCLTELGSSRAYSPPGSCWPGWPLCGWPPAARPEGGRACLSPGSTLRHQISTLSRHPDTPTPQCQSTLGPTLRHQCQASVRPVSSHLDVGHPRMASSSVNGVKAKPTLRHSTPPTPPTPPTLDTPDTPTLQASMLTRCRPRC